MEIDGTVHIAWLADGLTGIRVGAPRRGRAELDAFARTVADVALLERSVRGVMTALRERYPGAVEVQVRQDGRGNTEPHLLVMLRPARHEPGREPLV